VRSFCEHVSAHPKLLDQLVAVVDLRLDTNDGAASFQEAAEHVRWEERVHIPNVLIPMYARYAVFSYPRLNGMIQFVKSPITDGALGTRIAECKLPGEYARRLQWADDLDLQEFEPPAQGELFEEVNL